MVKRKRIALIYRFNYDFSAGVVIYIQNLIKGFKLLDDDFRPEITIIYSKGTPIQEIKEIEYPYIKFYLYKPLRSTLFSKVINRLSELCFNVKLWKRYSFPRNIDIIYPFFDCPETISIKNRYYWKPDFQEMYYPEYVSTIEYEYVISNMKKIAENERYNLVVSSEDSLNDYKKFFGPYENTTHVLRFVSIIPDLSELDKEGLLHKYDINKKYFMVSNQFWPHKNHLLVLQAINLLKEKQHNFVIVFSGKQSSYRDEQYFSKLQVYINENNLKEYVKFIGFIPREEQLILMKNSLAVIQPSMFEGWSTIIEDCKALNQFVISSDLSVNFEQIQENCIFFDRYSAEALAKHLNDLLLNSPEIKPINYDTNIDQFKKDLMSIFKLGV